MERVVILGPGGAGKSTLARRLSRSARLPVIHLDPLYWGPRFEETDWDAMLERVGSLARDTERWIIEGSGAEGAAPVANTVIFLDLPRHVYCTRFVRRWWRGMGRQPAEDRPAWGESLRPDILLWLLRWPGEARGRVLETLGEAEERGVTVVHLHSSRDVERFLASLDVAPAGETR